MKKVGYMLIKELNLNQKVLKALLEIGYQETSPIQEKAIPAILSDRDVLGIAQTGTGKTCAFAAPMIHKIMEQKSISKIKGLIVCPTRELAIQIYDNIILYSKYTHTKSAVIYGGVGEANQKKALSGGVDILIATPGRLLDFIGQKIVDISKIDYFVLDEADRMLDMGFIHDIKKIMKYIPVKRQTLLFSATIPDSIKELCNQLLKDPVHISITPSLTTVEKVQQKLYYVSKENKIDLLIDVVQSENIFSAIAFSRTKHGADKIQRKLHTAGIKSAAIHGNKSQNARQSALLNFKQNKIQVLVATDIAARGLDIDFLSHVINYDMPDTTETYVHRIGRTARAGREGIAITFSTPDEENMVRAIEKECKVSFEKIDKSADYKGIINSVKPYEKSFKQNHFNKKKTYKSNK